MIGQTKAAERKKRASRKYVTAWSNSETGGRLESKELTAPAFFQATGGARNVSARIGNRAIINQPSTATDSETLVRMAFESGRPGRGTRAIPGASAADRRRVRRDDDAGPSIGPRPEIPGPRPDFVALGPASARI